MTLVGLLSETTCKNIVLQLDTRELQQTENAVHDKQIFLVVDDSTLSGIQYLNIGSCCFAVNDILSLEAIYHETFVIGQF